MAALNVPDAANPIGRKIKNFTETTIFRVERVMKLLVTAFANDPVRSKKLADFQVSLTENTLIINRLVKQNLTPELCEEIIYRMQVVGIDVIELIQKVRSRLVLREEQNVYADINGVAYGICYNTISLGRIYSKIKEALPPHSRPIQRSINSDMPRVIQRFRKLYEEYTGAVVDQMKWED